MVKNKQLGNNTKGWFYKNELTPDWLWARKVIDPTTGEYVDLDRPTFPCLDAAKKCATTAEKLQTIVYGDDKGAKFAWKVAIAGFIYSANRIPEISDTIVEIDNDMKWAYNFEMGPFESWDAIGV